MWWGTVTGPGEAKITGGRVRFAEEFFRLTDNPMHTEDEERNRTPYLNYHIYPDTETIRHWLYLMECYKQSRDKAIMSAAAWKAAQENTVKAAIDAAHEKGVEVGKIEAVKIEAAKIEAAKIK
jgi:hypothetical protein